MLIIGHTGLDVKPRTSCPGLFIALSAALVPHGSCHEYGQALFCGFLEAFTGLFTGSVAIILQNIPWLALQ